MNDYEKLRGFEYVPPCAYYPEPSSLDKFDAFFDKNVSLIKWYAAHLPKPEPGWYARWFQSFIDRDWCCPSEWYRYDQ